MEPDRSNWEPGISTGFTLIQPQYSAMKKHKIDLTAGISEYLILQREMPEILFRIRERNRLRTDNCTADEPTEIDCGTVANSPS
jgi:hypothetical protein